MVLSPGWLLLEDCFIRHVKWLSATMSVSINQTSYSHEVSIAGEWFLQILSIGNCRTRACFLSLVALARCVEISVTKEICVMGNTAMVLG